MRSNESNVNLPTLFGNKIFRVPNYQRGYAWGERQLTELWDDIDEIVQKDNGKFMIHYTGVISLKEVDPNDIPSEDQWIFDDGFNFYDVVDGQQRLTSLVILLNEIIRAYSRVDPEKQNRLRNIYICKRSKEKKIYSFSYYDNNNNLPVLLKDIYEDDNVVSSENNNVYTYNLRYARDFFRSKISKISEDELNIILNKLQTALVFDIKYIDDELSVQAVFETMNNRGKPLTTLEKLKNRLLYLTTKLNENDETEKTQLAKKINDAWGKIYDYLGKNPDPAKVLDEDEFLSAHLSLIRRPTEYVFSEQAAEQKVFQMFCNKAEKYPLDFGRDVEENTELEEKVSYSKIEKYVIDISSFVPYWYKVMNSGILSIKKILCLNASKEMKLFLATLLSKEDTNKELVADCLDLVNNILFRNSIPGLWILDERTFASYARDLHNEDINLEELYKKLIDSLNAPCNKESMIHQFRGLFEYIRGNKGYHRWVGLKYFLFEYEDWLMSENNEFDRHLDWDNFDSISIEHILPQKWDINWSAEMNEYLKGREFDDNERDMAEKIIINTLGNLTLLRDRKNSSLQNDGWDKKRKRYSTGSFNEIEISKNESWNEYTILNRGKKLVHFMEEKIKGLSLSDSEMDEMLFYQKKYLPKRLDTQQ